MSKKLSAKHRKQLISWFGNKVNFDKTERILYGHDIAAIPSLMKPLVGNTTPGAVVQPTKEEQVIDLVRWAAAGKIPLTPRGKASSGYGGAIPVKKGIVVDFYWMKNVLSVDKNNLTVTVEPGITWEKLEDALKPHDLALRLYPTSAPSSTVGGWLAQGGAGIGSYRYGFFAENVVSARVVLPTGEVREFSGEDLQLIADAEGITGFITQVTVQVQEDFEPSVVAVAFPNPHTMAAAMQELVESELPVWSAVFINPKMAELKNRAPVMMHHGHPAEHKVLLPAAYTVTIAMRDDEREAVMAKLPAIIERHEGEILSDQIAEHEWKHRFKLMTVKRLGPSLIPTEVVVPLEQLGVVMEEVEDKVNQPLVKEGVIIAKGRDGKPEAVILGFIPHDQRKFSYNFVFGLALTVIKVAKEHGGRAYSTGIYFSHNANEVLGAERAQRLRAFKKQVDPKGIMNPGKVFGYGLLKQAVGMGEAMESLIRPFGNHVITEVGEKISTKSIRNIPPDVVWYAYACSQCGYCVDDCDQFYGRGWESQSPRGKWYWLREYMEGRVKWTQQMVDTFLVCTTCEMCNLRCSSVLPIEPAWMKLRGQLIDQEKKMTFPPFEIMAASVRKEGNIWAGYRAKRTDWFPKELWDKHGPSHKAKIAYFAGCTASYVEADIGQAAVTALDAAGIDFTYMGNPENCCGTPMLVAGKWDIFEEIIRSNIAMMQEAGVEIVTTSCPACDMMWRVIYPQWAEKLGIEYNIQAKHYSEILAEAIKEGKFSFTREIPKVVTWHDSCHIGRASGVYEPPREMIRSIPGVDFREMAHNKENGLCCGSVLTLIKEPEIAKDIGYHRLKEAIDIGAETVLALCPCCEFQLRVTTEKTGAPLKVMDLAHFTCSALGHEFPDPNPEVQRQWAVFEAMIELMTPQGFAELMDAMWPELLSAMPLGMGGMMRVMGKIGPFGKAMLFMMKPIFPILFPRLLPGMMPKVMPTMLECVSSRIPMPDYMQEQMPELMPKVMDNLMPHMLPDVVPLVTPKLIRYLTTKD